jgi:hypothetical protein
MWFFMLVGGLIVIAFIGLCLEAIQSRQGGWWR